MTTVINTPASNESTGFGVTIGVVLVIIILLGVFFVYGLPKLQGRSSGSDVNVNLNLPSVGGNGSGGTGGGTTGQ